MKAINTLLAVILLAGLSSAYYTMDFNADTDPYFNDTAIINFSVKNSGDEPAYATGVKILLPEGLSSQETNIGVLDAGESRNISLYISVEGNITPGSYPVVELFYLNDKNSYPISMLNTGIISYKTSRVSLVNLLVPETNLTGEETVTIPITIFNRDDLEHNVSLKLYLPNELGADEYSKSILLSPHTKNTETFRVYSNGALYGSNFLIAVSASYVDEGIMRTYIGRGRVATLKAAGLDVKENPLSISSEKILYLAIVLIAVAVLLAAYKRLKK